MKHYKGFRNKGYTRAHALFNAVGVYLLIARLHITTKNVIIFTLAFTIGWFVAPAKVVGLLITKLQCLEHDNCIITTIQEFDV